MNVVVLHTVYPDGSVPADFNNWTRYIAETNANDYFRRVPGSRGVRRTYYKRDHINNVRPRPRLVVEIRAIIPRGTLKAGDIIHLSGRIK